MGWDCCGVLVWPKGPRLLRGFPGPGEAICACDPYPVSIVSIRCAQQRLSCSCEHVSHHSLLAAEDSFLDKDQIADPAEAGASGGEVDPVAAADLARVAPGQDYLAREGLP